MRFLKRGGTLVLTGTWQGICLLHQDILKREDELLPPQAGGKERAALIRDLRQRALTTLDCLPIANNVAAASHPEAPPTCHPEQSEGSAFGRTPCNEKQILHYVQNDMGAARNDMVPGLLGENSLPDGIPILLPVDEAERLLRIEQDEHPVRAIGASLVAHPDVLVPRSQETINLVCEAIKDCEPGLPNSPRVLEIGCGSGVLSIAAWQILQGKSPSITATDILPEAVATTRLNWRRLAAIGKAGPEDALTTRAGSLFEPVDGQLFDLIIFNAPWVVAPARNRAELALNDEGQKTIFAFAGSCRDHLSPGGRVIIGYADNAAKASARLETCFQAEGLVIQHVHKDRIHTRRAKRQWQNVYAYVLIRASNPELLSVSSVS